MLKSDSWIIEKCIKDKLISPFNTEAITELDGCRIISRGLSSYGYDASLAKDNFKIFVPLVDTEIDAKNLGEQCLFTADQQTDADGSSFYILPPHSYALGMTVESFIIPRNIMAFSYPKRIYSRREFW
jgi:dCTP deaminase